MPFCTEQVLILASGIYQSIGYPSYQSVGLISGWITSSGGMINPLNNSLDACFYLYSGDPCIGGGFGILEGSIASLLYQANYAQSRAMAALAGSAGSVSWTTMKEGDTTITRESAANLSKAWLAAADNALKQYYTAIHDYKLNRTIPGTVDGSSLYSFPSP